MSSSKGSTTAKEGNMPIENPVVENGRGEDERTLTDHLNKKLLESFLARMEAGTTGFPNIPQPQPPEEEQDFDE